MIEILIMWWVIGIILLIAFKLSIDRLGGKHWKEMDIDKRKYSIWCIGCKFKANGYCDGVDECLIRMINQERKRIGSESVSRNRM